MPPANDNTPLADDILTGAAAIAAFLGFQRRQVYHLASHRLLPIFKLGDIVCARKSTLISWIAQQEATARAA